MKLHMHFYFQTVQLIDKTDADVKIFAGDVNALPFPGIINGKRQPYSLLTSILTDSLVDRYVLFLKVIKSQNDIVSPKIPTNFLKDFCPSLKEEVKSKKIKALYTVNMMILI